MDNTGILIDTSIIIGYLRKKEKENTILYNLYQSYDEIFVSSFTVFEIFAGINPENKHAVKRLFEGFIILSIDAHIVDVASREYQILQSQNTLIGVRNLFIGATAIAKNLPLATLNTEHFKGFPTIKIVF